MKTLNLDPLIGVNITVAELLRNKRFQTNLACGSRGLLLKHTDPVTGEVSTYWINRTVRLNEQLSPEKTQ
jgi:hypothetical protein